ncbi:MAG: carbohydrate ABC transporter permease [Nitrososphaeria archaeon]
MKKKLREVLEGYLFSTPAFLLLFLVLFFPFLYVIYISFFTKIFGYEGVFSGLRNYLEILQDPLFHYSLYITSIYTVCAVLLKLIIGLGFALLLSQDFKGRSIVRAVAVIPWGIPLFVVAAIFFWFFDYNLGLANLLLKNLFNAKPVFWLGPQLVVLSIIYVNVWKGIPFFMVNLLGVLQTVPRALHEAAEIDGANAWQRFRHITIPGIRYVILIVCLLSTIWTFGEFDTIFYLTRGGPGYITHIIPIYIYFQAFSRFDIGMAATASVLTVPIFAVLISVILWALRR